jgi:NADPH:quinone reductase-like Zn-dependent oxidoreductase
MQQVRYAQFGDPAKVLELVEIEPEAPGPGIISVALEATPIHYGDLLNIVGAERFRHTDLPRVPGIEGVGRIVEIGEGVTNFKSGDRVLFRCSAHGGTYTQHVDGAWQEIIRAPADRVYRAPEGDACQIANLVNVVTADMFLTHASGLDPGDWLIQNGANSNVGRYLICLAKERGIKTINVVRRESLIPELKALGADEVLLDGPDLGERAKAIASDGMRVALDCIAGDATTRLAECLEAGGTIHNYGLMSDQPCHIHGSHIIYRDVRLVGYFMARPFNKISADEQGEIIERLAVKLGDGSLPAKVAGTYALSEFQEAVRHASASGKNRDGKVMFVIPGQS